MEKEITDKNFDLLFKMASDAFKYKMLRFLGVDAPEIKEILPTELPVIEANIKHTDFVFRLADESLLHLEFQSSYASEDTYRFLTYDVRLHKKYRQKIRTIVIYIRDAVKIAHEIVAGSITYQTETISMHEYDGDKIYAEEKHKIAVGEKPDQLKLMFLPLMNSTKSLAEQAKAAIKLSKQSNLPEEQLMSLISAIIVLADKILTKEDLNNIWEEISMLKAIQFAEEKGIEKGIEKGMEKGKGEELRATVLLLLAKKFKIDILPDEITQKIESADIEQLRKVREDIFEIESLDEVREYF